MIQHHQIDIRTRLKLCSGAVELSSIVRNCNRVIERCMPRARLRTVIYARCVIVNARVQTRDMSWQLV